MVSFGELIGRWRGRSARENYSLKISKKLRRADRPLARPISSRRVGRGGKARSGNDILIACWGYSLINYSLTYFVFPCSSVTRGRIWTKFAGNESYKSPVSFHTAPGPYFEAVT